MLNAVKTDHQKLQISTNGRGFSSSRWCSSAAGRSDSSDRAEARAGKEGFAINVIRTLCGCTATAEEDHRLLHSVIDKHLATDTGLARKLQALKIYS